MDLNKIMNSPRSSMTIFVKLCQVVEKFVNIFKAMTNVEKFWTLFEHFEK